MNQNLQAGDMCQDIKKMVPKKQLSTRDMKIQKSQKVQRNDYLLKEKQIMEMISQRLTQSQQH